MKKFLAMLLSFVMLLTLTMPAMAAETTDDTGKDVTATYDPTIEITGVTLSTAEETESVVTAENNVYTLTYPNGYTSGWVKITVTGKNLGLIESGDTDCMVQVGDRYLALCNYLDSYNSETDTFEITSSFSAGSEYAIAYTNDREVTSVDTGWTLKLVEAEATYQIICGTYNDGVYDNGTVTADKTYAAEGETVTLTVSPAAGYALYKLRFYDADGNEVNIVDNQFKMPANLVSIEAIFKRLGTELSRIYFTGDNCQEGLTVYYSDEDGQTGETSLALADGETDVYYASEIPEWTISVALSNFTGDLEIPTDGRNLYNVGTGEWTTYTPKATYGITVSESENGTVNADKYTAAEGDTVTLTVTPAEGYVLDTLTVTDAEGNTVTVENNSFTMPAEDVVVQATFVEAPVAYINSVSITVDGVTYESGSAFVFPDTESISLTISGENLQYMTSDYHIEFSGVYLDAADNWRIENDGQKAELTLNASDFAEMGTGSIRIKNGDAGLQLSEVGVVYITYKTDLTTVYFKNTDGWETITANFYYNTDIEELFVESVTMTLVPGENNIYQATVPQYAGSVEFAGVAVNIELKNIPMASENTDQYNPDSDTWTKFVATEQSTTSVEITWGSMSFTYIDTEDADGNELGWQKDTTDGAGTVTVTNTGDNTFTAIAEYKQETGFEEINGYFATDSATASAEISGGSSHIFTLELKGKPNKAITAGTTIGSVTITISEAAEG